ncbi:ferritin-like domain-containing protein [Emticicia sp. C21]|uniref:ferritin-like domain-containing protein n=1 Tax=Emticicia sp. C21 TaxID=2302915 RepID=UPI000E34D913|nr:ferritin-like domain-containing protein [Emticicia sp. C21]RFS17533.1 ferritin-like domain-containing protein [Emticicia sp. C21]
MNLYHIISELEKVDEDVHERLNYISRRSVFNTIGKKVSALAIPTLVATSLNKAYAATPVAMDVLNFALTLEYLDSEYFTKGINTANLIPGSDRPVFTQVAKHENEHVAFIKATLGNKAIPKPTFDFTGKGLFPDVFTNYKTFAMVGHAFEDHGVRAYKGQAGNLMAAEDKPILEAALRIHSVEARHTAGIRYLINIRNLVEETEPWITLNEGTPAGIYTGEDNTMQGGVETSGLAGRSKERASEAFDEPLSREAVLANASRFIAT